MDDIRTLLRYAVDDVHADPDLAHRVVRRHRGSRLRLVPLVAAAAAVLLVLGLVGATVALTRSHQAAPATPPSPAPALPVGPEGPGFPGGGPKTVLTGRVYSLGPSTADDGRPALTLVFFARLAESPPTNVPAEDLLGACSTRWVPGTRLADDTIDACVGGLPPDEPPVDGPAAIRRPPADKGALRMMRLTRRTVRAEVKLARTSTWRSYATPQGRNAPVDLRQPVQLLGADDPAAPQLIGVSPAIPVDYRYLGTDTWDANGRPILDTREGNYCGPEPSKPAPPVPPDPCPR